MTSVKAGPPLSPASDSYKASGSQNVSYEKFAPRGSVQVALLSRLASLTASPALSQANLASDQNARKGDNILQAMANAPLAGRTNIPHESENETLKHAVQTSTFLSQQLKHTTSLRLALRASINIAEDISTRHAELIRHSGELSAAADRLQEEQVLLTRHAEEIGTPLKHYDAVDRIGVLVGVLFKGKTVVRSLAKVKVDDDNFAEILDEIDDACDFFGRESGGKEVLAAESKRLGDKQLESGSLEYYRRALALQDAAIDMIKEAVADRIASTANLVAVALNTLKVPVSADQLEASLIYTRFHGISSRSNRLLSLVKARVNRSENYHELLLLCRNTYCVSRESLLRLTVRAHMDNLKDQHGAVGMTRLASVFLVRLCTVETSLYMDFFGEKKDGNDGRPIQDDSVYQHKEFQDYLTSLCSSLHRTIRRSLVTMMDLDILCQIVSVLREERALASASPTTLAASRAITSVIKDAQERLIFCANSTLQKEVIRFKPKPSDLNYPDKLIKQEESKEPSEDCGGEEDAVEKHLQRVYESWFPPMRSVLRILSKIFRVVETPVFEAMALESVQACTRCLKEGASFIRQRKGIVHSDLFLVKHLLILREQLSPFDMDLRTVERQLDFSEAGRAVARFMANRNRRLFSMSTENALITLMREGVSVQESSVDSKRDLEDALRSACNDFIEHTSTSAAGDLLAMVEQCRAAEIGSVPFNATMNCDHVLQVLGKSKESIEAQLTEVSGNLNLYMDSPGTQSILFRPVLRKIGKSVEDVRKLLSQVPDGELEWNTEKRLAALDSLDSIEKLVSKKTQR